MQDVMMAPKKVAVNAGISLQKAALTAGIGLLFMVVLAPFAFVFVLQGLVVQGDAATTAANILASEGLFRLAVCSFLLVAVLDVVVAWALYVLLKPVNSNLSLLSAWFRLGYVGFFGAALLNLFHVLALLNGPEYLSAFEASQLNAQLMLYINAFYDGWAMALVVFSFHLFLLGYLTFQSGFVPKLLGVLLIIAAAGYLADSLIRFLFPAMKLVFSNYTFVGEVLLIFWLLIKGSRLKKIS